MKSFLLGTVAYLALTGTSYAAAPPPDEEVIITGRLEEELPQDLSQLGYRVQVVTAEQIENGGYYDIAQALQSGVPGLFIAPKHGPFDYVSVSLQGSRTSEVLWLVDGVRISNRLYNSTTPLDTIPAHMVERIEVIEGGQSLFYGTTAVAGVINVITKGFSDRTRANANIGYDTNEGYHINGDISDTLAGHKFVVFGSKDTAKGYRPFPLADYQPSATDRNRGYDVLSLRFSASYQRNDVKLDNLRPARSSASQVGGLSAAYNERVENIASAKIDYTLSDMMEFFVKGYYHKWDSYYSERRNVIATPGSIRVISDREFWGFKDYGVNALAKFALGTGLETFLGYDYQTYSGRDDVLLIAPNSETVHAFFGQVRTTENFLENTTLAAGLRYNAPENADGRMIWTLSGQYDISPNLYVKANGGTSFRLPDAYELFAIDPSCCFDNPDLKPETSSNFNGSIGGRLDLGMATLNWEAIGFYREARDLIVDVDDGTGSGNTITANADDKTRVRGFELVASVNFNEALSGSIAYTYNNSEGSNLVPGGYDALPGIPTDRIQASFDYHPMDMPFGVTATVNTVGRINHNVGGFGVVKSGNYTVFDLSTRVFIDQERRHRVSIRAENLLDERYFSGHARGFSDARTAPQQYLVGNLGVPRTIHFAYSFAY